MFSSSCCCIYCTLFYFFSSSVTTCTCIIEALVVLVAGRSHPSIFVRFLVFPLSLFSPSLYFLFCPKRCLLLDKKRHESCRWSNRFPPTRNQRRLITQKELVFLDFIFSLLLLLLLLLLSTTRAQSPPSLLCLFCAWFASMYTNKFPLLFSLLFFSTFFCVVFVCVSLVLPFVFFFLRRREKLGDLQFPFQMGIPLFLNKKGGGGTKGKRNLLNSHFTPGGGNCTAVEIEMDLFTFFSFLFLKSVLFIVAIVLGPLSSFHWSNLKEKLCRCPLSSSSSLSFVNIHHDVWWMLNVLKREKVSQ